MTVTMPHPRPRAASLRFIHLRAQPPPLTERDRPLRGCRGPTCRIGRVAVVVCPRPPRPVTGSSAHRWPL